jgi:hypothetical protein
MHPDALTCGFSVGWRVRAPAKSHPHTPECAIGGITRSITSRVPERNFGEDHFVRSPKRRLRSGDTDRSRAEVHAAAADARGRGGSRPCRVTCLPVPRAGVVDLCEGVMNPDAQSSQQG